MRSRLGNPEQPPDAVQQARSWLAAQQGDEQGGQLDGPPPSSSSRGWANGEPAGSDAHDGLPAEIDPEAAGEDEPAGGSRADTAAEPDADSESVARGIALRLLTVRARTRHELESAFTRRSVPDEAAARVLDRLTEVGLIDDAGFAAEWVAFRQARRHLSRQRLRQELRRKGVDSDDIDGALAGVDVADELEAARTLGRKKLATLTGVDGATRYRRLAGVLSRRGFSAGTVSTVLSELLGR